MDETYSPIKNRAEESYHNNSNYYRLHAGLKFKILEGLNIDLKYQTEGLMIKIVLYIVICHIKCVI